MGEIPSLFYFLFMSIQEAISTVYKLRNEAYE